MVLSAFSRALLALTLSFGWVAPVAAEDPFQALLQKLQPNRLPDGFFSANGRLESEQVEIATKIAGRISDVLVKEGDLVDQGQILATIDDSELQAQLQSAQALQRRAEQSKSLAQAVIAQRQSELKLAEQEMQRVEALHGKGFATTELLDTRRSVLLVAQAALNAANASFNDADAAIDAAKADVARIKTNLDDMALKAPRRGRVEYKLAQKGEVLGVGARVLTLIDLTDVYMTLFVPSSVATKLAYDDEARLILDAIPQYVVPARVSFVASEAQFTPKTVETREEREKLMFRVKLSLPPDLLKKYEPQVKTGVRGVGYMRTDAAKAWPEFLNVKLPQ